MFHEQLDQVFYVFRIESVLYVLYELNAKNSISCLISTGTNLVGDLVTHIYYADGKKLEARRQECANNRVVITDQAYLRQ
jgi:hypothetical protein